MARLKEVISCKRILHEGDIDRISLEIKVYCSEKEANNIIQKITAICEGQ